MVPSGDVGFESEPTARVRPGGDAVLGGIVRWGFDRDPAEKDAELLLLLYARPEPRAPSAAESRRIPELSGVYRYARRGAGEQGDWTEFRLADDAEPWAPPIPKGGR